MKQLIRTLLFGAVLGMCLSAAAQAPPADGVAVHMVVTVEARHGKEPPTVYKDDVMVYQGKDRRPTLDWLALQGDHAGLELFILIDDGAGTSLGSQLEDLRDFIGGQPATTAIGVAYMRDGVAQVLQNPTLDHALGGKGVAVADRPIRDQRKSIFRGDRFD